MEHIPVLKNETIKLLAVKPDGVYLDLTLGRAGHASEILKRLKNGKLIAFDLDETAIDESKIILDKISSNYTLIHSNYRNFPDYIHEKVDGILMDLGVSSPQLDDARRGFSYKLDAPLDMRMDITQSLTAKEVVNSYSLKELTRIFREYGEEKDAYRIALNIVKIREQREIVSTYDLVDIIKKSKSFKELSKKGHPAKQVFQALRIEVNDELNALKETITKALDALKINGTLVVITFHSLEDRLVKQAFNGVSKHCGNRNDDYLLPKKDDLKFRLINEVVTLPSNEEIINNSRSKSAKLRGIIKIAN